MKKKPPYLNIVSNNQVTDKETKVIELNPEKKVEPVEIDYNEKLVEKMLEYFEEEINGILWKSVVRNTDELEKLYKMVEVFQEEHLNPLFLLPNSQLEIWIIYTRLLKRLSEIEYRIKKPTYEINLSISLLAKLFDFPYINLPDIVDELDRIVNYFYYNREYLELPNEWLIFFCLILDNLSPTTEIDKKYELKKEGLRKLLKRKVRKETAETIDTLSELLWSYIQESLNRGSTKQEIINFIGGNRLEYGVNSHFIALLTTFHDHKENYKTILNISKKGKLKKYYDRLSQSQNYEFRSSIFMYLYDCLCYNKFDYFENIFPIYTKLTLDPKAYSDLMLMYTKYATEKRIRQFLHKCFDRDSMLSEEAQKSLRRAILKK